MLGNEIEELANEEKSPGKYKVEFNVQSLTSSVYFYKIQAGSLVQTKKMILIK